MKKEIEAIICAIITGILIPSMFPKWMSGPSIDNIVGSSIVQLVPPGKLWCYIREKLIAETPEEHVRQRIARSLVEEYGYHKNELELGFIIRLGRKKHPVDIAIFPPGKRHLQENIKLIVETKREDIKSSDRNDGIDQLKSYMAACANCQFGLWTNNLEMICLQKVLRQDEFQISEVVDILPKGKSIDDYERPSFDELKPATELRTIFRRCHNYIHGNEGLPKDKAFHELLKVIFSKVLDERESNEVRFYVINKEIKSKTGQLKCSDRLQQLFEEVKGKYPHIFNDDEKIDLHPNVLAFIVSQLQRFSLLQTETDVKGEAYEEIVGANLRGDRGEFFTPRNVCDIAVKGLLAMYSESEWNKLKILDPACGTGGFLIAIINIMNHFLFEEEVRKWKNTETALSSSVIRLKEFCQKSVHGNDINPLLARACQMNQVMHGNGSANVSSMNSLLSPGEWAEEIRSRLMPRSFDLLFSNPPFGSKIPVDDAHVLQNYDLGHVWEGFNITSRLRASAPPEELFIEQCIKMLKPKGKLAIVLPDSILSNPGKSFIRYWILRNARILASIDLPREAFLPLVGTKTSLLFLEKKTEEEIATEEKGGKLAEYEIFMALAEKVGHDRRGTPTYRITPEGKQLLQEVDKQIIRIVEGKKIVEKTKSFVPIRDDDLDEITTSLVKWMKLRGKEEEIR